MTLPHVSIHGTENHSDRRGEQLDRRQGRRGGRRLTDRRPDILHGLPCDACDTGVLALADVTFSDGDLRLTYRCPLCDDEHVVTTDPSQAIAPSLYERALAAHDRDRKGDSRRRN